MSDFTKSLPTEVWLTIFDEIDLRYSLEQCRLVCKSWSPLVEKVMYKVLCLEMGNPKLAKVSKYLAMRPDLGRLVQKISIYEKPDMWPEMYKILQLTPNLKVIDGKWSEVLAKKVLPTPECSALKLEQLPYISDHTKLYLKSMLRFKDTLRSVTFKFNGITRYNYRTLGNFLNQFKHLQQLTIKDEYTFKSIRDLDRLLMNCNQIQHLRLTIKQYDKYTHTDKVKLDQWLANSVQRAETVKELSIYFEDDSIGYYEQKQPRDIGPDWMYYLAYKYPSLTRLEVQSTEYRHQHLILPKSMHMDTFVLKDWKFYDIDLLKQFIDMLAT